MTKDIRINVRRRMRFAVWASARSAESPAANISRESRRAGAKVSHPRLAVLLMVVAFLGLEGCLAVPLKVRVNGDVATIDVSTLGEYPTSVSRIRVSEASHQTVVWEVAAGSQVPQIWNLALRVGDNPVALTDTLQGRPYRIVFPPGKSVFVLKRRASYRLEIWNSSGWRRSSQEFSFAG